MHRNFFSPSKNKKIKKRKRKMKAMNKLSFSDSLFDCCIYFPHFGLLLWANQTHYSSILQRLAADFLSNYIFLSVGRVGSSTDLIVQRVEFVEDTDKRYHLMDLLQSQMTNRTPKKVCYFLFLFKLDFLTATAQLWF